MTCLKVTSQTQEITHEIPQNFRVSILKKNGADFIFAHITKKMSLLCLMLHYLCDNYISERWIALNVICEIFILKNDAHSNFVTITEQLTYLCNFCYNCFTMKIINVFQLYYIVNNQTFYLMFFTKKYM